MLLLLFNAANLGLCANRLLILLGIKRQIPPTGHGSADNIVFSTTTTDVIDSIGLRLTVSRDPVSVNISGHALWLMLPVTFYHTETERLLDWTMSFFALLVAVFAALCCTTRATSQPGKFHYRLCYNVETFAKILIMDMSHLLDYILRLC